MRKNRRIGRIPDAMRRRSGGGRTKKTARPLLCEGQVFLVCALEWIRVMLDMDIDVYYFFMKFLGVRGLKAGDLQLSVQQIGWLVRVHAGIDINLQLVSYMTLTATSQRQFSPSSTCMV